MMRVHGYRTLGLVVGIATLAGLGWLLGRARYAHIATDLVTASKPGPAAIARNADLSNTKSVGEPEAAPARSANRRGQRALAASQRGADAAYELAQSRQACMQLAKTRNLARMQAQWVDERQGSADDQARARKELAQTRDEILRLQNACPGSEVVTVQELNALWARAAALGSREAQYQYALNPRLNIMAAGQDSERWREWRDAAPRYLDELIAAGDTRAVLAMAAGSDAVDCVALPNVSDDENPCTLSRGISMILAQDPVAAYTYYFLDQLLGGPTHAAWVNDELARLGKMLGADEIASARADAQRRFVKIHRGS